jgi:protein-S-isoprenylcysteine O-methyltransferase Ste14
MYAFLDLALLGMVIAVRQPWLLVPWLGLAAVQAWQAAREAKVLEQAFGDAYTQYRARTWW